MSAGQGILTDRPALSAISAFLLFLCLLVPIHLLTANRYVALGALDGAFPLLAAHMLSKALVLGVAALVLAALFRGRLGQPAIMLRRTRAWLLAGMFGAAVLVCVVQALLPRAAALPESLTWGLALSYLAAIAAFSALSVCATLLILPKPWLHRWRQPSGVLFLLALIAVTLLIESRWTEDVETLRRPIEGATLTMSLWFYSLFGLPAPALSYFGLQPVLAVPGFAIRIDPSCSGYQGMGIAFVLLSAYMALEWRALRRWRAVAIVLAAIVATFILNSARIAVLFYIGVTGSPEVAVNGFHSNFGTLAVFTATALAILAMESPYVRRPDAGGMGVRALHARATSQVFLTPAQQALLARRMMPLGAMLLGGILVGLTVDTVNWFYGVGAAVGAGALWMLRDDLRRSFVSAPPGLSGFLTGLVVFGLWVWMVPPDPEASERVASALLTAPLPLVIAWVAIRTIGASVIVPLAEELAFRGALQPVTAAVLSPHTGATAARLGGVLIASLAFGLLHGTVLAGIMAGMVYGLLVLWRGSLWDAILAHGVTNFLLCLTVLVLGHWSYW